MTLFRELKVEGGSQIPIEKPTDLEEEESTEWDARHQLFVQSEDEHDIIVNIDQTNLSKWFGQRTRDLIELLKIATGEDVGWEASAV